MLVLGAVVGLCWAQAGLHPTSVLVFGAAFPGGLQALPGQHEEKTEHPTFVLVLGAVVGLCWAQAGPHPTSVLVFGAAVGLCKTE